MVVSTGGLLTQEEMNLWNFVAKRLSAPSDATDFWGVPSFYESVNRRMELLTDIVPRHSPRIRWMQATTRQPYASEGWWGVVFDEPVPTAYDQWETYTLRGRVTESEATHVRFDGQTVDDNYSGTYSFFLKEPVGDDGRFSVTFQFRAAGSYMLSTRLSKVDGEDVLSSRTGILVSARARPALGAKIRPPSTIRAGLRVVFDGSGSEGAESYSWDFGDGTVIEHPNVVSRPSHTYVEPGSYEVRLEVARGGDCGSQLCEYDTATAMVDVLPRPLTARLVTQSTVEAGMAVVFDGSGSVGAESYRWDFGDGTEIEHPNVVSRPSHTYVEPGSYEVRLEVARGGDCGSQLCEYDTAMAMVDVLPRPLTARLVTPS
ncbi:MAG: PKD domain-containing protein, partial [Chloroflexi bacterium]|nr:PKD domain-containing protein [Chloroflexota bacterium]